MSIKYFITGTDTEIGKTYISTGLLKAFNKLQLTTLGLKPIASGIEDAAHYPSDTLALYQAASLKLHPKEITPFAYRPAIAPHIAARQQNETLSVLSLNRACQQPLATPVDICIIEGFGGWYAPLNDLETMADFVRHHRFNVILVVGIRLGCLNHAILTQHAMQQASVPVLGWIANCIEPHMAFYQENISTLQKCLSIPYLGTVEHGAKVEESIDINRLYLSYFCG